MEVHAHTHTPRKKWTHYFWEFFMLFLAVTLGFIVENEREHYIEHKRAKEYAKLLKADLIYDTLELSKYLVAKDMEFKTMESIRKLQDKKQQNITLADLRFLNATSFQISPFRPHNATLLQLKSSGSLRYFQNIQLKEKLANYEWAINNANEIYHSFLTEGGGIQSEHILYYNISREKFLKATEAFSDNLLASSAGYNFKSWDEFHYIAKSLMDVMQFMYTYSYPDLKIRAAELIELLNKEFHLK